jgi:glycosyltransferase involved in cell wall biosynthesis
MPCKDSATSVKPTLIFFAGIEWFGQNTMPCHHLVAQLAKEYRVFYIDNFGALRDLTLHDFTRCFNKLKGGIGVSPVRCSREIDGVEVWQPWVIPTPRTKLIKAINVCRLKQSLASLYEQYGIQRPIIWTRLASDLAWEVIDALECSVLIYQSIDKFPEHPRIAESLRARYYESERKFNESADIVFASARGLAVEKLKYNSNTHFLPNGVSKYFGSGDLPEAKYLSSFDGPIVGFAGALGTATDLELLFSVAEGLPEVNFVFLGTVDRTVSISKLEALVNVYIMGLVDHAELPCWMIGFDVGLMPYYINHFQDYTFPSKLAEYLSFDLPIVATHLPELKPYVEVVSLVNNAEEMITAIEQAISRKLKTDRKLKERRAEIVASLTWETIGQRAIGEIKSVLQQND